MVISTPRVALRVRPRVLQLAVGTAAAVVLGLGAAGAMDFLGAGERWDMLLRLAFAVGGGAVGLHGWRTASGRERQVRAWIFVALVVWVASESLRLGNLLIGRPPDTDLGPTVLALAIAAAWTYVATVRRRMPITDEMALYLDALTIASGLVAATLVIGGRMVVDEQGIAFLTHAAFFLATLGATTALTLATRVPFGRRNQYVLLLGLLLGGAGYVGLLASGVADTLRTVLHAMVGIGAFLVAWGGAAWTAEESDDPRFVDFSDRLRDALPMAAVALAPPLIFVLVVNPEPVPAAIRLPAAVALGLSTFVAVARQTTLLRDREQAVGRERRLLDELRVAETQYRSVVERVPGVVYVAEVGETGRWDFVSAKISDLLGYSPEEWLADPKLWERSLHPEDRERILLAEGATFEPGYGGSRWEYRLVARDGRTVWVLDDEEVIARDDDGRPRTVQGILLDLGDRKRLEEQLRHQALHDPLTGLPNRVLFADRVTHALTRRDAGLRTAVLFLDLDDFKTINDSLGHAAGDEILVRVAERLLAVLRTEDTACRLGGDEFAVLIEDADPDVAAAAADRILAALRPAFSVGGREVTVRGSIGVASRTSGSERAEDLLRRADTAMYAAKTLGKDRAAVFEQGMEQPIRRRLAMRTALESAMERGELYLEYQPIVSMPNDALTGVEALARWQNPVLGRVPPAEFIPLAEEIGLVGALGEWVLESACSALAGQAAAISVSVNVSAQQLGQGRLQRHVAEVLDRAHMTPDRLVVELTESSLAAAGAGAEAELREVRQLGVRVALDDFGSGYSSLEYLGRLPIDILKVDRSLVTMIHQEAQRREVLRAILHIAAQLGMQTIVEGVEHPEQRDILTGLGFDRAQGFLFSPAVDLSAALSYGSGAAAGSRRHLRAV